MKQEMIGWQWYQLNHMQIICTSLQMDNYASTSSFSFYRPDALPDAQPTASKHWMQLAPDRKRSLKHVRITRYILIIILRIR